MNKNKAIEAGLIKNLNSIISDSIKQNPLSNNDTCTNDVLAILKNYNPLITKEDAHQIIIFHRFLAPIICHLFNSKKIIEKYKLAKIVEAKIRNKYKDSKFNDALKKYKNQLVISQDKQTILKELYHHLYFLLAPKSMDKNGVIYTPVTVVEFMLRSTEQLLKKEFNKSITDKNINVYDPFTGREFSLKGLFN